MLSAIRRWRWRQRIPSCLPHPSLWQRQIGNITILSEQRMESHSITKNIFRKFKYSYKDSRTMCMCTLYPGYYLAIPSKQLWVSGVTEAFNPKSSCIILIYGGSRFFSNLFLSFNIIFTLNWWKETFSPQHNCITSSLLLWCRSYGRDKAGLFILEISKGF